jgi:N utilization substance protein A
MDYNLLDALELLEREKGVPAETILDALANALVSAYKRTPGAAEEARVTIDPDTGEISVYGQDLDEDGNVTKEWEDTPSDFGRIAAQTAKQVILQRLRDAKREQVYDLYEGREGDLVTGIVQQSDHRYAILDLGNAEAIMPSSERIPYERLDRGNRVKAYILEVRGEGKGPQIVVSRSHPEFIRSLFELEVPELVDGDVEIRAIAREPGHRTKIAVTSNDPHVDPVGACVGARGSRVRQVVNELRGEKVDIVEWRDDTGSFIAEALSPARVKDVRLDDEEMVATVIVPDHQLSLAIGKEGQNARLAARLSGYKIDIRSESQDLGLDVEEEAPAGEAAPSPGGAEADASVAPEAAETPEVAADDAVAHEAATEEIPVEDAPAETAPVDEAAPLEDVAPVEEAAPVEVPSADTEPTDATATEEEAPESVAPAEPVSAAGEGAPVEDDGDAVESQEEAEAPPA